MKTTTIHYSCDVCGEPIKAPDQHNLDRELEMADNKNYMCVRILYVRDHIGAEHICDACISRILNRALSSLGG